MFIIVQTQAHIFLNDRELEFDGLEPLSVGLAFLIYLDFGNQCFHDLPLFLLAHDGVQLVEVDQHLVDVIPGELFRFDCHFLCSGGDQQIFCILDFIIHLVKPIIKVCLAFVVVFIVRVKGIYFLHQL